MKKQVPMWPVAVVAILIVSAVLYFLVVGPKRGEAARLGDEIAELETKVQTAKLAAEPKEAATQHSPAEAPAPMEGPRPKFRPRNIANT